jgi:hypothetical protein
MYWLGSSGSESDRSQMLDSDVTILTDAERGGRASGKETMVRPRYQDGSLTIRGKRRKVWLLRWREDVLQPDGSVKRIQHAETLGPISCIKRQQARAVLQERVSGVNQNYRRPQATMSFQDFVGTEWRPNAELALRKGTVKYYSFQLERHILPVFGSSSLCELNRARVEGLLSILRQKGHARATIRGVRATVSTVLQSAVERGYVDRNPAHGIRIKDTGTRVQRRFFTPGQVRETRSIA